MSSPNSMIIGYSIASLVVGVLSGWGITSLTSSSQVPQVAANLSAPIGSCSGGGAESTPGVLFTLDGTNFTQEQLPGDLRDYYYTENFQSYEKSRGLMEEIALRMALSKSTSMENLPPLQELLTGAKVSESEIKKFYEEKKSTIPTQVTYDQVKPQIEKYLQSQKMVTLMSDEVKKLEKSGRYKLMITAPVPPVVKLDLASYPVLGADDAPNVLVEVSDYMCGHCQKVHPEVKSVLEKFKKKIKFVQMNYSLNPAGMSGTWIRGAFCAQQESVEKFWKYHHAAFELQSNEVHDHSSHANGAHTEDVAENRKKASSVATKSGLDLKKFETCLESEAAHAFVARTNKMLSSNGVSGTPTFFLNNVKVQLSAMGLEHSLTQLLK
jgi:protein-disulfide isomerase